MKRLLYISVVLLSLSVIYYAQKRERPNQEMRPVDKITQLEKVKLIEVLNLNEETSVRFFSRRNDHQKKVKELVDQRNTMIDEVQKFIKDNPKENDNLYKDQVNKLFAIDSKIAKERENFTSTLYDILTPQQVARYLVFEHKFRKEIRETLFQRGKEK